MHHPSTSSLTGTRIALLLATVTTVAVPLVARPARACGGGFSEAAVDVGMDAQIALYALRETSTDLVVLVNVPAIESEFGVVVPVPAGTTLLSTPVNAEQLARLEQETRPEIVLNEEDDSGANNGSLFGCGSRYANGGDGDGEGESTVTVSEPVDIGPVTAVVISGETGDAIADWLGANGFVVPAGAQDILDGYTGAGAHLVAMKRNEASSGAAASVGVRMSIPGDHRGFALRMAQVGAAAEVAITIFIAHPTETFGPSTPFAVKTIDDLDAATIVDDGYRAAVRKIVDENGGRAFVAEGVSTYDTYDNFEIGDIVDDGWLLTRVTTVMSRDDMTEDVALDAVIDAGSELREIDLDALEASTQPFAPLLRSVERIARDLTGGLPLLALFLVLLARLLRRGLRPSALAARGSRWASMVPRRSRERGLLRRRARGAWSESAARRARSRSLRRTTPRTTTTRANSRISRNPLGQTTPRGSQTAPGARALTQYR